MKKHLLLCSAVCLLLVLLCACGSNDLPTAPSTPTPPPTAESPYPSLEGLGTFCDILPDGDGYILMTHTGFYRLDSEFHRTDSNDLRVYNDLYAEVNSDNPFYRMTLDPDLDTPLLTALTKTSQGIFFFCYSNGIVYQDGSPWFSVLEYLEQGVLKDMGGVIHPSCNVQIVEYHGAIFTMIYGFRCNVLIKNNDTLLRPAGNEGSPFYRGMMLLGDRLYAGVSFYDGENMHTPMGGNALFCLDENSTLPLSRDGSRGLIGSFDHSAVADGKFFYEQDGKLKSTDGSIVETWELTGFSEYGVLRGLHALPDGRLLAVDSRNRILAFSRELVSSMELVTLRLGYLIHEGDETFTLLADAVNGIREAVSVEAIAYDSADALASAVSKGEIDLVASGDEAVMRLLADRGMLTDLFTTNPDLKDSGLAPTLTTRYLSGKNAFYLPAQMSIYTCLTSRDRGFNLRGQIDAAGNVRVPISLKEFGELLAGSSAGGNDAFALYSPGEVLEQMVKLLLLNYTDPETGKVTLPENDYAAILEYCRQFNGSAAASLAQDDLLAAREALPVIPGKMYLVSSYDELYKLMLHPSQTTLALELNDPALNAYTLVPQTFLAVSAYASDSYVAQAAALIDAVMADTNIQYLFTMNCLKSENASAGFPININCLVYVSNMQASNLQLSSRTDIDYMVAFSITDILSAAIRVAEVMYEPDEAVMTQLTESLTKIGAEYFAGRLDAAQAVQQSQQVIEAHNAR